MQPLQKRTKQKQVRRVGHCFEFIWSKNHNIDLFIFLNVDFINFDHIYRTICIYIVGDMMADSWQCGIGMKLNYAIV